MEPESNWRLNRSSNYSLNMVNDRYVELNNILQEQEERLRLNNLVSECLYLDQPPGGKQQKSMSMKWADTTQQSLANRIGKLKKLLILIGSKL